ncbi:GNAT family N-acetyltransferase [Corallincola platygyrae]|uniref:GNAT family N-acetyltransferase n=1 Tax=Corallincola platygyrae TaxID=1193278 RepID=A0ABW4XJP6_9GAMM
MKIENTERLALRMMDQNDGDYLFELDQDPEVMKYINGGKTTSREDVKNVFLPRLKAYTNTDKGWGLWMVTVLETGQYIGWVLVRPMDFFDDEKPTQWENLELGWRFKRDSWGKGYGTEAAKAVVDGLKKQGSATRFSALAEEENAGSINIMTKLGMTFDKRDLCKDPLGDLEVVYYSMPV